MVKSLCLEQEVFKTKDIFICLFFSVILGLFSHVRINLFFTPVPLVLQNSIAILFGAYFGSKKGSLMVLLFLLQGAFSLPVFANGSGLLYLAGPTGGYLFGYFFGAYLTGKLIEMNKSTELAIFLGHLLIILLGSLWLGIYVGFKNIFLLGFLPFIFGCFLKSVVMIKILKLIKR
jgi:biotin transport system substrate-specific component